MAFGDLYRHYKGNIYKFLYRATHTETLEDLVVYQSVETGAVWVRPAKMFFEYLETEQYTGFRFTPLTDTQQH
jgi:hypothetical protein